MPGQLGNFNPVGAIRDRPPNFDIFRKKASQTKPRLTGFFYPNSQDPIQNTSANPQLPAGAA